MPDIYLTFDDGPTHYEREGSHHVMEALLDILKMHNARATFFCIGQQAEKHPGLVKRAVEEGHVVGNHTYTHPTQSTPPYIQGALSGLDSDTIRYELSRTNEIIREITGYSPYYFRTPEGRFNKTVNSIATALGLSKHIHWHIDPCDWDADTPGESIIEAILSHASPGSVVLCHDKFDHTPLAMEMVIPTLKKRGYNFKTIAQEPYPPHY